MKGESCLEELKKKYSVFEKKYKLPSFQQLNEDFDIEKASEHETDYPLREIRKLIMDKVIAYLRFIELLLNPSNGPMFFFALVKALNGTDKAVLEKVYNKLGEFEIDVIELDNSYSEKNEAEFIMKVHKRWQDIKKDMADLVEALRRGWNSNSEKKVKGYLG
jgi:hypothetical protein